MYIVFSFNFILDKILDQENEIRDKRRINESKMTMSIALVTMSFRLRDWKGTK